jgi:hypothetical protein
MEVAARGSTNGSARMQTDARPYATTRPPALVLGLALTLFAMVLTLVPAVPAHADELPHNFDIGAACQSGEVPSTRFQDIGPPHDVAIECLAWYDIARGRTATYFGTNEDVTRAQAAAFITRLLREVDGLQLPGRDRGAFSDVGGDSEFARNIEVLANVDPPILRGFGDGTFRPSEPILRDQFASVIDRALAYIAREVDEVASLPPGSSRFPDVGTESPHFESISRLADAQVVLGRADGTYQPRRNVLRGQTASIMARVLGSLVYVGVVPRPPGAPAGTVQGLVSDVEDAQPNEDGDPMNVTVHVRGDAARAIRTGTNGRYSVNLPPGDYEVSVQTDGYVPYLQQVSIDDGDTEVVDFRMYRTATVPSSSTTTTTTGADAWVTDDGDYWRIPIYTGTPPQWRSASDATEIRLVRPDGVILRLGAAGTEESWWSRNADGTSDRNAARNLNGDHTLYYRFGGTWYDLTATFDNQGRLTRVNDTPYTP